MNEDFIRIAPKPVERPNQVGAIFSSQLNLTPEKCRPKQLRDLSWNTGNTVAKQPVFVENHENTEGFQRYV
jgi:hypothetical protein